MKRIKVLKDAASGLNKTLYERLVCPLSRQPLRYCEETNCLISDAVGVSFPIKDGIPCLVPADGKILDTDAIKPEEGGESSGKRQAN
ncbi:uncharacterized protein LOC126794951 [Argentina anserina]|uniref:uncharacterized protein LOC126794951 n=1 Tax=Argentina anserina TaxID=57926 RepID=UPI0021762BE0|nr:uncharacterized protein LOC126794951 [Potentilla anserina]